MTGDGENSEVLDAFLASVFNVRGSYPEDTQPPELGCGDGVSSEAPVVGGWLLMCSPSHSHVYGL